MIERTDILLALHTSLEPLDFVNAAWQGGAAAFDRIDQWSDIDLQIDVDDNSIERTFEVVEQTLSRLSPIILKHRLPEPTWHGHSQAFYRLRDTSEFLMIDLVVIASSHRDKFLEREIHGNPVVLFDKGAIVQPAGFDPDAMEQRLRRRLETIGVTLELFRSTVLKELHRGNDIEALSFYQSMILRPLVEVLRMRYVPARSAFHTRYIQYDLPSEILAKLQPLFFVRDAEDLRVKFPIAEELLRDAIAFQATHPS